MSKLYQQRSLRGNGTTYTCIQWMHRQSIYYDICNLIPLYRAKEEKKIVKRRLGIKIEGWCHSKCQRFDLSYCLPLMSNTEVFWPPLEPLLTIPCPYSPSWHSSKWWLVTTWLFDLKAVSRKALWLLVSLP